MGEEKEGAVWLPVASDTEVRRCAGGSVPKAEWNQCANGQ